MRYLTRQVAVDAIQWDGKEDTFGAIRDMVGDEYELYILDETSNLIQMDTEMGVAYPEPGEWIVWDGEFAQAYKDERFKELFELQLTTEYIQSLSPEFVKTWLDERNQRIVEMRRADISSVPHTQEENIEFRKQWDARVDAAKERGK